tara:strand:+ start:578 stop:1189 length:612 start_codon:yes stop_codon:yes gene_type:complete
MSKKPIIVFEGIEGSGKSYHISRISKYLSKKKIHHIKIREPGGSKNAEKIRKFILNKKSKFNKNTDLLLYLAARSENFFLLKKNYKKKIILIDRFVDSTIAYQHYGLGVNLNLIKFINKQLLKDIVVDFTFLNKVSIENMCKRLKKRKTLNRYDKFKNNFYEKVQNGYLKIANKNKKKYLIIDSNRNKTQNETLVINKLNKLL